MTQTITCLFDNYADAKSAVQDLENLGVAHGDLSIVANNVDGAHGSGHAGGLLAGLGLLAIPGLGPIVAAGWLAATAAGAGIGALGGAATGSIVGALKNAGHSDEDAHVYAEGVRRGGTLLSARVPDEMKTQAEAVLARHNSVNAATRGSAYRQSGWNGFDETAPAYTHDQVVVERTRYGAANEHVPTSTASF
jgi:hypothetical protein